jgi:transposase
MPRSQASFEAVTQQQKARNGGRVGPLGIIRYLALWKKLTGFLRIAGAPINNNKAERALKTPILNRRNAYYFKTLSGAAVGSVLMSLIRTCTEAGENPIEYLATLLKHSHQVKKSPQHWFPWNYTRQVAA